MRGNVSKALLFTPPRASCVGSWHPWTWYSRRIRRRPIEFSIWFTGWLTRPRPFLARVIFTRVIRPLQTSEKFPSTPAWKSRKLPPKRRTIQSGVRFAEWTLEMLSSALQARQGIRVMIPVYCLRSRVSFLEFQRGIVENSEDSTL